MNIYLNQLNESIKERLVYFRLEIKNIPTFLPIYKEILDYIEQILTKIESQTNQLEQLITFEDSDLEDTISKTFKILNSLFYTVSKLFDKIERSKEFSSNSPFIISIKDYFTELFENSELLFLPNEGYAYSTYELSSALLADGYIGKKSLDIIEINIPRIEKNNILNHVLCAHEIGHIIFSKKNIGPNYFKLIDFDKLDKYFDLKSQEYVVKNSVKKDTFFEQDEIRYAKNILATSYIQWLEELFCDAIGLTLFGPAFFFASVGFLPFHSDFKTYADTHPPLWLRMYSLTSYMREDLEYLKYQKFFSNDYTKNTFEFWYKTSLSYYNSFQKNIDVKELYDNLFGLFTLDYLKPLFSLVLTTSDDKTFNLNDTELIKKFSLYIKNNVPPLSCEKLINSNIAPIVYIINSGWNVYKTSFDDFMDNCVDKDEKDRHEKARQILINLISKSLTLSLVNKIWQKNDPNRKTNS